MKKHGLRGRWYAKGPSIQSYPTRAARSVCFKTEIGASVCGEEISVEIDINNCFLTLFVKALADNGAELEEFKMDRAHYPNNKTRVSNRN